MDNKKGTEIIRRPNLNDGQLALYTLIYEKIKDKKPILAEEAIKIWTESVCREIREGKPCGYNYYARCENDQWFGAYEPLNEWEIKQRSVHWLMVALGALVLKGYLKVIPTLKLE